MKRYLYGLLITSLTLAACSPAVASPPPAIVATDLQTASVAPTVTQTPTIAPTATVEPTKPPIDPASNFPAGKFVYVNDELSYFIFTEDGKWIRYTNGSRVAGGTFIVEGDTYTQTSFRGFRACPVPMSFKFSFDGTYLEFKLTDQSKEDPCAERRQNLNLTYMLSE